MGKASTSSKVFLVFAVMFTDIQLYTLRLKCSDYGYHRTFGILSRVETHDDDDQTEEEKGEKNQNVDPPSGLLLLQSHKHIRMKKKKLVKLLSAQMIKNTSFSLSATASDVARVLREAERSKKLNRVEVNRI